MKEPGMKLYPLAEKYVISLYIENQTFGCKDTFIDSLELIPLPQSQTTNDTICLGDTAKIFQTISQPNIRHLWSPVGIIKNNQWDTVFYKRDSSFQYTATVIDTMTKCQKQSIGNVMVIRPMLSQKLDTTVAPGADVTLPFTPMPNYRLNWAIDSFLSCTDCKDPLAKYLLNPITYKVVFYDEIKNCFRDSSIYKINIFPDILVTAPTAFTPNGDGNNDIFYARGFGIKKLTSFKIYNRQGTLIFFSQSEDVGWDGNYKGEPQNTDAYFYTIEGESYIPNKRVFKEGNFMLLR
jgi:gliding motility-associated-like protein